MKTTSSLVVFAGGGTLGSVTPLLALYEAAQLSREKFEFLWIGTKYGPEERVVTAAGVPFTNIHSGKLRRYWSISNLFSPFLTLLGFVESLVILLRRPSLVISAGGYVAVPVAWAAWCLGIRVLVHEQDRRDGLANKLIRYVAARRTSVWEKKGTTAIGNLIRPSVYAGNKERCYEKYQFSSTLPLVVVTGGGTGSLALNTVVVAALPELTTMANVIHLTGRGKLLPSTQSDRYHAIELSVEEWPDIHIAADVVVSRAGMANLSEMAALKKIAIVVPIPNSHQGDNAAVLREHNAAVVIEQDQLTPEVLVKNIADLILKPERGKILGQNLHKLIPDGTQVFLSIVKGLLVP